MLETLRDFIRPLSVAVLIGVLLLGALVAGVLEAISPGVGVAFTSGVGGWFKAIPDAFYNLVMAGLVAYTGGRTVQKATATYATAKYRPPVRDEVDDPKGGS